ncbi:hypothetical protein [Nostoc sp. DSM 114167]|jgi:hypothetical protein|uniref:hypothetical protein n=1 Tax=Nostoc sp. DSM 114167 TaxID=3439050 RepID=UPI004045829A
MRKQLSILRKHLGFLLAESTEMLAKFTEMRKQSGVLRKHLGILLAKFTEMRSNQAF